MDGMQKRRSARIAKAKLNKIKDLIMKDVDGGKVALNEAKAIELNKNARTAPAALTQQDFNKLDEAMFRAYDVLDHFLAIDVCYADTISLLQSQRHVNADYVRNKWKDLLSSTRKIRGVLYNLTNIYSGWFDNAETLNVDSIKLGKHINALISTSKKLKSMLWEHHYRIKKYYGFEPSLENINVYNLALNFNEGPLKVAKVDLLQELPPQVEEEKKDTLQDFDTDNDIANLLSSMLTLSGTSGGKRIRKHSSKPSKPRRKVVKSYAI